MTTAESSEPSPAELFERFFGPSVFQPWTEVLLEHERPRPGDRVLDLACATGTVARHVASEVDGVEEVVGLDVDPEMLTVARKRAATEGMHVSWRLADAHETDLPDDSFDVVFCQQGIQFFEDPTGALREARRVLAPGGRLALTVWQPLERHPVYGPLLEAEADYLGADRKEVGAPFMFGDRQRLRGMLTDAGFEDVEIAERTLEVEFPDPSTFVALTVMAGAAVVPALAPEGEEEREALVAEVERRGRDVLERHTDADRLRFPMPNYVAVASA